MSHHFANCPHCKNVMMTRGNSAKARPICNKEIDLSLSHSMNISYQGPGQPVVGLASVVAQGVDHPPDEPEEAEGGGHLSIEQPG